MLLPAIAFSLIAAAAVWWAGRRDQAKDPWLTFLALALLLVFPLLFFLPKWQIFPHSPESGIAVPQTLWKWLPWAWGAGVALASLRLLAALVVLNRWRRNSERIGVREAGELIADVRLLKEHPSPVAAGIFKPVIFVPEDWHSWNSETQEAVLAHEMKHHQRRDPLLRAIASAACTLHWFNPLVWWMADRLGEQCEFACDEALLAEGMPANRYANVLCDLAAARPSPATALAMAHQSGLEARVRRMFSTVPTSPRWAIGTLIVLTLLTALGLVVLRRADPPPRPVVPIEEIRTRLEADPFPAE